MSLPVSIRFKEKQINNIKSIARQMSAKLNRDISYADLIRELVNKQFPCPADKNSNIGLFLKI